MSGKRILPKNITGKEKLSDLIDETFLAYNSARLKEGVQLFANKMLEAGRNHWHEFRRRNDPGGHGLFQHRPDD